VGITFLSWWLTFIHAWTAPARYFERRARARREHELALARLQVDANTKIAEAQAQMFAAVVKEMSVATQAQARASAAQSEVWTTWLTQFTKVTTPTSSHTITEQDEAEWEQEEEDDRRRAPRSVPIEEFEKKLNEPFTSTNRLPPPIDPYSFGTGAGL
jgi:hypothetical protein